MTFDIELRDNGANVFDIALSSAAASEETTILLWFSEGLT
jgi:hypothetical protein